MPELTINDQKVQTADGQTILDAAVEAGITIPTLCHHKDLSIVGSCRLCMVETGEGAGKAAHQVTACSTPVAHGMVVHTETPSVVEARCLVLEMLLYNYHEAPAEGRQRPKAALGPNPTGDNEFIRWVQHYGVQRPSNAPPEPRYPVDSDPNPFIRVDLNQCILCTRCVRACEEVQGRFVWGVGYRGGQTKIIAGLDTTMLDARCESCGACAAYCPTGALADRMSSGRGEPEKLVTTTCGYCGVGCQFDLNVQRNRIVGVTSNPAAPVNGMSLCVKGRYGWDFVHHKDRLTRPLVRRYLLEGALRPRAGDRGEWVAIPWSQALQIAAEKLTSVKRESGPEAIGVLSSAKCTNEENYLMQKFARQVIGVHNVDHCARLCHSSTVAGLAMAFGSGAMSNSMRDIVDHAQAMFIIGSNTTEQHPVFGAMIRQAVLRRHIPLLVADPRRIDITEFATLHLRHKPGADVALLNGLMNIILENRWHNEAFIAQRCEGFDEFRQTVSQYDIETVADITGVSTDELRRAAEILATRHPLAVIWAMGITQHTTGVINVLSLANLQMLLGNLGVPGGGVNPLRGQNNVQGACDMGALPNVFPGYQPVTDEQARANFDAAWETSPHDPLQSSSIAMPASTPGLTVTEIVEAAGAGDIRALYILGEDPVLTEPDSNHVRQSLQSAEFVLLQEIFPSETSHYADMLLPAASFAEKSGTFTNTERRIQLLRRAIDPPGEALADWEITSRLARRILEIENRRPVGPQASWDYPSPAEIMDEIAAVTPSYAGVSFRRLERGDQLQWPVLDDQHPGTPILHVGRFPRGKGKFHSVDHLPPKELPDQAYPMLLTTGRVLYHWHGGELTRRADALLEACPETVVEISPEDASRLDIKNDSLVRVISRRGEMTAHAVVTDRVSAGVVFGNFHFPGQHNVNNVTICALDPLAKIPEYKVCAVAVQPV